MFRLLFSLALTIFLAGSFGTSQNKSSNQTNGPSKNCETKPSFGCCKDGKDGKDGQNGKDGSDGANGKDGRDGRDGTSGGKGEKGEAGIPGRDGNTGIKEIQA